jgi:hypothetical protein
MPNWKKVIVSGSNAVLNNITASGHMSVLSNAFTVESHTNTELEIVGDIIASGDIEGRNITSSNHITSKGKIGVGIPVSSPLNTFHINHDGTDSGIIILRSESSVTNNELLGGIGFGSTETGNQSDIAGDIRKASSFVAGYASQTHDSDAKGGYLTFGTKANDASYVGTTPERMRILSDGKVGINVTSPKSQLEIRMQDNTANNNQGNELSNYNLFLKNSSVTQNAFAGIAFDVSTQTDNDSIGAAIRATRTTGSTSNQIHANSLSFHTNDAGDDDLRERMRITNDGKVGIFRNTTGNTTLAAGNTSLAGVPNFTLDVHENNSGTSTPIVRFVGSGSGTQEILRLDFPNNSTIGAQAEFISFFANGSEIGAIEGSSGDVVLEGFGNSDIRIKKDIVYLSSSYDALSIVKNIDVAEFSYIKDTQETPDRHVGFIAQNLQEVYPYPVVTFEEKNEFDGLTPDDPGYRFHSVRKEKVVPLLTQAIKELTLKIESLEARIQELES